MRALLRAGSEERAVDVALGLSILGWGIAGLVVVPADERLSPVRVTVSVLQMVIGVLIATRKPLKVRPSFGEILAALPSVAASGEAMWLARPFHAWPILANCFVVAGGIATLVCLAFLGRSFAVLPGVRDVVSAGPYRLIRHPVYAAELVMMLGCAVALGAAMGFFVWMFVAGWVVVRIVAEERRLNGSLAYVSYCKQVRWRLMPGLW